MNNLILFLNQFISYIVLMAIIVVVGAIGFAVGVKWWKSNEAKTSAAADDTDAENQQA
ncbi:MAG: hypothetical protein K6E18_01115 [Lachnospiraceae bacterium]|nr:hypothetical protein [Lachnospiraceae bacterium]